MQTIWLTGPSLVTWIMRWAGPGHHDRVVKLSQFLCQTAHYDNDCGGPGVKPGNILYGDAVILNKAGQNNESKLDLMNSVV